MKVKSLSRVRFFETPWTVAYQAPLPKGFSRQGTKLDVLKSTSHIILHGNPVIKYEVSEVKSLSHVQLFATPWTVAYQAPLPMGFSRQEYWSGLPFLSPVGHCNGGQNQTT